MTKRSEIALALALIVLSVVGCSRAPTCTHSPADEPPAEAVPSASSSVGSPSVEPAPMSSSDHEATAPLAAGPVVTVPSGLEAIRTCLASWAELRLAPEPAYRAKTTKALATQLGFRQPRTPALSAFCEPELRADLCAYANCSAPGVAFTWKRAAPKHGHGASGLLIVEAPTGQAAAYAVGALELWEPEFACGCMAGSEFARVTRPRPDVVVVAYFAQNRPRGMCDESYSTSTWFLDEAERPVAAVLTNEPDTGPTAVAVRRSDDEIHVRAPGGCEARIAWSELRDAALREAEQRASGGPPR